MIGWTISDAIAMTKRNLLKYIRVPPLLVFSTVQPVMIVILFTYVFGGAIEIPGTKYIDFLIPGILIQTMIFGSTATGIGLADDLSKGLVDRFKSLPMARSAVLTGRTLADTVRNIFVVILVTLVGALIGFRFHNGLLPFLAGLSLAILMGFAFSWISAAIGLAVADAESAQTASFVWLFPLTFASSVFVETSTMPGWLQAFADANPLTSAVNAMRALSLGDRFQQQNGIATVTYIWRTLAWVGGILVVFVPISVRRYRRT